jgi:hypothetical protein
MGSLNAFEKVLPFFRHFFGNGNYSSNRKLGWKLFSYFYLLSELQVSYGGLGIFKKIGLDVQKPLGRYVHLPLEKLSNI